MLTLAAFWCCCCCCDSLRWLFFLCRVVVVTHLSPVSSDGREISSQPKNPSFKPVCRNTYQHIFVSHLPPTPRPFTCPFFCFLTFPLISFLYSFLFNFFFLSLMLCFFMFCLHSFAIMSPFPNRFLFT